ncbi:MAG: PQQ-dependent sugar dehydrogenase [Deltaproteobacteria bacterium]|nr:PQQ-dependent sugar dehydrogenase [Deltaproteobacteria bacterium]
MRYLIFSTCILVIVFTPQQILFAEPPTAKPCELKGGAPLPTVKLELAAKGLKNPVHITHAGDGSGRLFIAEQAGIVRILRDGNLLPTPFLDIREKVKSGGEMGLLSIAFHPKFKENGRFFVNYTSSSGGLHTVISEFQMSNNPDVADKKSERIILTADQPFSNHNGGQIAFGPDGYLYIGMGDGGSANDPQGHGQNLSTLLGAMLRIDVDRKEGKLQYNIPDDNPFKTRPNARPEIWAYGLRNPWRFSFDPLTGILYAGDVGQDAREEIDIVERGQNYGWNIMEGSICTSGVNPKCNTTGLTLPIIDYGRDDGISVIGGFVYRGHEIPGLCGSYIYGDWGSGKLWALRRDGHEVAENKRLLDTKLSISSFGIDEAYEVYVVDYNGGVYKVGAKK